MLSVGLGFGSRLISQTTACHSAENRWKVAGNCQNDTAARWRVKFQKSLEPSRIIAAFDFQDGGTFREHVPSLPQNIQYMVRTNEGYRQ